MAKITRGGSACIRSAEQSSVAVNKILLIDDDERLARPLSSFLSRHGMILSNATHPEQGIRMLEQENFELVILDVMLPDMDGFAVCRRIRETSNIPVVMLSARGEIDDRLVGLELGADDYIAKPFEPRELVVRIQNILKRSESSGHSSQVMRFADLSIDKSQQRVIVEERDISLTTNEYQLLVMLASNPGRKYSRDDILKFLKGTDAELFSRAVDIQVSRLRQKLKPTDYIKTVWGAGYQFVAPAVSVESRKDA